MIHQIQIVLPESSSNKEKGDFLEDIFRSVMEAQRYDVTQRLHFTGTEIDLLCTHKERISETALVECKAKIRVDSGDIKNFMYDLMIEKRALLGYFVHTTELQHQVAGLRDQHTKDYPNKVIFIGPEKLAELLCDAGVVHNPPRLKLLGARRATKRILLYTATASWWIHVIAEGASPTGFVATPASGESESTVQARGALKDVLDEIKDLLDITDMTMPSGATSRSRPPRTLDDRTEPTDAVADVQESKEWYDLKPVGSKFFVGRENIGAKLYRFIKSPLDDTNAHRVFFVEGKSGWGKSSLIANLRARSRNRRNKNKIFVLAVDARSASTSSFPGLAFQKLVSRAVGERFLPAALGPVSVSSWLDVLSDSSIDHVVRYLESDGRILVLIFDQFEDVFRKADLFRAFHKLMMDVADRKANIVVGFSWKTEISIPMDNPAYSLWQQMQDHAASFLLERFSASEIEGVIRQLEKQSAQSIPVDLKRRLKEGAQGFPWLIKKLATHCYLELEKGETPESLVDQNLNVEALFRQDEISLSSDESRALKLIAQRGYESDPLDVSELDHNVSQETVNRLLARRLIVKTGPKYTVYWDHFRDYLVEGVAPRLGESFLLRQHPSPCIDVIQILTSRHRHLRTTGAIKKALGVGEGTALNRLRELRNLGVITKQGSQYRVRSEIRSVPSFREYIRVRLDSHIIVRHLRALGGDMIDQATVAEAMVSSYSGYSFSDKTWNTYAGLLIAWIRYCGVEVGGNLVGFQKGDSRSYTPQSRPDRVLAVIDGFPQKTRFARTRVKRAEKPFYDLKSMGFLVYEKDHIFLTKQGLQMVVAESDERPKILAREAIKMPKIRAAADAYRISNGDGASFEKGIAPIVTAMQSKSYRTLTTSILKAWARLIEENN